MSSKFFLVVIFFGLAFSSSLAEEGTVRATFEADINRIAPGEFLPFSVKLVNFGSERRVDVTVNYEILDNSKGKSVYKESETVAVDTTASFIKRILLPSNLESGTYTATTNLFYPFQERAAVSQFQFNVAEKLGGVFKSDLIVYTTLGFLIIIFAFLLTKWFRPRIVRLHDYNNRPKHERIYYEMLSDIIAQMRLRIGDDALEIAKNISDLEIDERGRIINIKKDPSRIIALLIARYEKLLGRSISFGLRQEKNKKI